MILPHKVALCLGFNLPEVSENNQTKLLEKSLRGTFIKNKKSTVKPIFKI